MRGMPLYSALWAAFGVMAFGVGIIAIAWNCGHDPCIRPDSIYPDYGTWMWMDGILLLLCSGAIFLYVLQSEPNESVVSYELLGSLCAVFFIWHVIGVVCFFKQVFPFCSSMSLVSNYGLAVFILQTIALLIPTSLFSYFTVCVHFCCERSERERVFIVLNP